MKDARIDVPRLLSRLHSLRGVRVGLGSVAEPLMHPQLAELAEGLSDLDMEIELLSNGALLRPEIAERLARCNLTSMAFSFDGVRKETYESIRVNARFETTLGNIEHMRRCAADTKAEFVVNYVIMQRTLDEIADAATFWEARGFHWLNLIPLTLREETHELLSERVEHKLDEVRARLDDAIRRVIQGRYRLGLSINQLREGFKTRVEYPDHFRGGCVVSDNPESHADVSTRTALLRGDWPGMSVRCASPFTRGAH